MGGGAAGMGDFSNPFDLFESFFGANPFGGATGGSRGQQVYQGEDERYDLTLDFIEAVFGTEKEIEILRLESCGSCEGTGVKAGTSPSTCRVCGGSGQMVQTVRTPLGNFQQVSTCTSC